MMRCVVAVARVVRSLLRALIVMASFGQKSLRRHPASIFGHGLSYQVARCCFLPRQTQITNWPLVLILSERDEFTFKKPPLRFNGIHITSLPNHMAQRPTSMSFTSPDPVSPNIDDGTNPRKRQRTACDRCKGRKQKVIKFVELTSASSLVAHISMIV